MENLKDFRTIILGHLMTVYIDHKNLAHEKFTTERVIHWHLLLEEYVPNIKYIKGPDNDAAETLSRLTSIKYDVKDSEITKGNLAEIYCVNKLDSVTFLLIYIMIDNMNVNTKDL